MQSNSSGSHGSSSSTPPRAEPTAADVRPPLAETVALPRAPAAIGDLVKAGPGEPIADPPAARAARVPTEVGVPIVAAEVDPPIEGMLCTRGSVEADAAIVRIPAMPTAGCVEVAIAETDDGVLVPAPIAGVVDDVRLVVVPTVESVVPASVVVVVPESVVVADPVVVPSEVSAGSIVAEGPTPSFAAKELKSVVAPKPKVASKASKSGSAKPGTITAVSGGKLNGAAVDVAVTTPPVVPPSAPVVNVEACAKATHGVAMSAAGATQLRSLFIPPPCRTSTPN